MSDDVLDATLGRLVSEDLLEERLTISWHGAEPLMPGVPWFERAFQRVESILSSRTQVQHVFQSNGVLIDETWCRFLARTGASIGVSLDGSAKRDTARVNWSGRSAHERAVKGAEMLNDHGIPWTLLSVITWETMADPEDYIAFVRSTGCARLGFKVEETNVGHRSRLAGADNVDQLYAGFVRALWDAFPEGDTISVREFTEYRSARRRPSAVRTVPVTLIPLRNLTVAWNGDFTIFAGELLFRPDDTFVFGNVLKDTLLSSLMTPLYDSMSTELLGGAQLCAAACPWYRQCGSFYVSQKYAEHGTFLADETLACRLEVKILYSVLDEHTHDRVDQLDVAPG